MALADAVPFAVAHFPLDEASGSAEETIGNLDATDNNTVGAGTGLFSAINAARDFDSASTEYFNRADNAAFDLADTDWMIRVAFNYETAAFWMRTLCGKNATGGSNGFFLAIKPAYISGQDRLTLTVGNGSGLTEVIDGTALSPGTDYVVWAWHDATNNQIGIRVNAGSPVTVSHSTGVATNSDDFTIGRVVYAFSYYDGLIADLVILDGYILDDDEMDQDWNGGDPVPFADWDAGGGGDTTLSLNALSATAALVAPSITVGTEISIGPLSATATPVAPPVISIGTELALPATAAAAQIVAPSIAVGTELALPALVAAGTPVAPTISFGTELSIGPLSAAATIVAPSVGLSTEIELPALQASAAAVAPAIAVGTEIGLPAVGAAGQVVAPSITFGIELALPALSAAAAPVAPTLTLGQVLSLPALSVAVQIAMPEIVIGLTNLPPARYRSRGRMANVFRSPGRSSFRSSGRMANVFRSRGSLSEAT